MVELVAEGAGNSSCYSGNTGNKWPC
jgi:hypothetical protein